MLDDFQRVPMAEFDTDLHYNLSQPFFGSTLFANDIANIICIDLETQSRSERVSNYLDGHPSGTIHKCTGDVCNQLTYSRF
jgi:hypothetical protein